MTSIIMAYPLNVGKARTGDESPALQEQLHSIQFSIITRELSRQGAAAGARGTMSDLAPRSENSPGNRVSFEDGGANAILQAGTVAGGVAAVTAGIANPVKTFFTALGAGGVALATGTSADDVTEGLRKVTEAATITNRRRRTNKVIRLYIPASPREQYGANWSEIDMGLAAAFAEKGTSVIDDIAAAATTSGPARDRAIRTLAGVTNITAAAGFDFRLQDIMELGSGKVANPNKAALFKSMNFRSFQYSFKFAPKSQAELDASYDIINEFRMNMHPERSDRFFLQYPSEFQITYQYAGKESKWLTKIADCALVDMTVDYGAGGAFTTIQRTEGAPSEITMTLQFKELEVLTAEHFMTEEMIATDLADIAAAVAEKEAEQVEQDRLAADAANIN
jgi:hypothetical protein